MNVFLVRSLALLSVAALAACGGGSHGSLPATPAKAVAKAPGTAALSITIPLAPASASATRRPAYISPATTQLVIDIQQSGSSISGYPQTIGLTPTSTGCSSTLASTQCNLTVSLTPGSYTMTLTTEDASNNPLSAAQSVPVTIVGGTANAINVSLGGIATSTILLPGATSTLNGNMASGYALSKCASAQAVSVYGLDADGNIILGSGAPTPALTSNDAQMVVATPAPTSPNTFSLMLPAIPTGNTTAQLTASLTAADGGSAPASSVVDININHDFCDVFTPYEVPTTNANVYHLAIGPDGNPWFTEYSGNNIGTVDSSGNVIEYPVPTSGSIPYYIAAGADGNLWFTEGSGNKIGQITTAGTITEYPLPAGSTPGVIDAGSDGNLWFSYYNGGMQFGTIATSGTFGSSYANTLSGGTPLNIIAGPDGALWFTQTDYGSNNYIGRIDTGGNITDTSLPASSGPQGITAGPDGALWFTEECAPAIGRITTGMAVTTFSSGGLDPVAISTGPDGNLWYGLAGAKVFSMTTAGISTQSLTAPNGSYFDAKLAPDGSMWFVDQRGNGVLVHLQ